MQRVKNVAELTAPKKYLDIRVGRKPGDGGWYKIPRGLNCTRYTPLINLTVKHTYGHGQ